MRPGVRLTRASPLRCVMALMAVDLPEFERPAKAIFAAGIRGELICLCRTRQESHMGVVRHGRRDAND